MQNSNFTASSQGNQELKSVSISSLLRPNICKSLVIFNEFAQSTASISLQLVYHLLTLPKGTYGSGWLIAQNIQNQAPKSETVRCMCVCACIRMFLRLIKSVATDWVWGSISLPSHLVNSRESQLTSY